MSFGFHRYYDVCEEHLSISEIEVLQLYAFGLTSKEVSEKRFTCQKTTQGHICNSLRKLDCLGNSRKAICKALRLGIIHLY